MKLRIKKEDRLFIGVIALIHIVFFLLACSFKRIYMGDSFEYIYEAVNIRDYLFFYSGNAAMPIAPEYMTQRQPLYPLALLGVYLFSVNNWIVLLLQNALSVANLLYLRRTITGLGYKKKYDALLLVLLAAYPAQFINANTIAPDILLQSFTLLYFGLFIRLFTTRQLKYGLLMGLSLAAGALVKPVLYPFAVVHVVFIITLAIYQKNTLQRQLLVALLPLCIVMLYSYHNSLRTGKYHFSSNQAFNAIYYYYPFISAHEGADSANRFLAQEREKCAAIPDYASRYDYANQRGSELLRSNFIPYMAFHLKHSARLFIEPGKGEIDLFTGRLTYGRLYSKEQTGFYATLKTKGAAGLIDYASNNPTLIIVLVIGLFNMVRLVGLFWFFRRSNIHPGILLFTFILLGYFAVAAGPIANTRYLLPVSPIVIGLAVMGIAARQAQRAKTNIP
jgi:4-amino-4-deoxy-L-arabinose transferase-like glycosyltransferase